MPHFNKIFLAYVCITGFAFVLFFSCQRELSPNPTPVSEGTLLKDSNNNCAPVLVAGNYYINQGIFDSNYLEADVNIISPGSYTITTDTVNGYYFNASGIFTNTGLNHVRLSGYGMPVIAGTNQFNIKYNGSICEASIIITDTFNHKAVFTLEGAPDNCMNDTVYGSYIKGVLLDTNAKVKLSLNVTVAGTYNIITNTINGFSFSASGTLAQTGLQNVFLSATGLPLNEETDVFTVNTGSSICNFPVTVLTAIPVVGDDYYPLSNNSYWTYDDLVNIGDTIKETIVDSTNINNYFYKIRQQSVHFGGPYQYYDRKSGSDYFEYAAPNKYTSFFQYKKPVYADIPFLKENLTTNAAWQSPEYIDTTTTGSIISLKYEFVCLNPNVSITINNKAFTNVYEIRMHPLVKQTDLFVYTGEEYFFYYAQGIGLIYMKKTLGTFIQNEIQIRNWHVNQ